MHKRHRISRQHRLGTGLLALALLMILTQLASAGNGAIPYQEIRSQGPLSRIVAGADLSRQVAHANSSPYRFYPSAVAPADAGVFVAIGGRLFAPDFANHGTTATGSLSSYETFTPVSQTPVTGLGTMAAPFQVVTVADAGDLLRITQTDTYIVGQDSYRTDVRIQNLTSVTQEVVLYWAADCYLDGSEVGYGVIDPALGSVACVRQLDDGPPLRMARVQPLNGSSSYYEASYEEIWRWISTQTSFANTCRCTEELDNGIGLSWPITLAGSGQAVRSHSVTFAAGAEAPTPTPTTGAPLGAAIYLPLTLVNFH